MTTAAAVLSADFASRSLNLLRDARGQLLAAPRRQRWRRRLKAGMMRLLGEAGVLVIRGAAAGWFGEARQ